ncbi:MAG: hypothetical protein HY671_01885 [Chloroflexi bacterium]|nr:hypothetical protein [Chloroflexota bacterium]
MEQRPPDWQKYRLLSRQYLDNSALFLERGEPEKAGEFLWGSVAEAIKTVAARKDIVLKSHRDIWDYASKLAKEMEDQEVWHVFSLANFLHGNFYESSLERADILVYAQDITNLVNRLLGLGSESVE